MTKTTFEETFKNVPQPQKEQLLQFRSTHPSSTLMVHGHEWDYLVSGHGQETLVLLTGGLNSNIVWFQIIAALEDSYRVLAIRYPNISTMAELVEGAAAILDAEHVQKVHLLGESLGGILAQCFVRRSPERVDTLILASTAAPEKQLVLRMRRAQTIIRFLPSGLLRSMSERRISHHLAEVAQEERAFWVALMRDQIVTCTTKTWLLSQYSLLADYCENYQFAPDDLEGWNGAILILRADDDQLVRKLTRVELPNLYPQASIHTFHNAGHIPPITKREEYIEAVKQFLAERQ